MRDLKDKAVDLGAVGYGWLYERKAMADNQNVEEKICAEEADGMF